MKQLFTTAICALALSFGASAQQMLEPVSVTPNPGVAANLGSFSINFSSIPSPNKDCTQTADFYYGDNLRVSILSTDSRVQMGVEGQADTEVTLAFEKTPLNMPGSYTVVVPQGFLTFNNGSQISAPITLNYTVNAKMEVSIDPAPGYYKKLPSSFTLTFPGATAIEQQTLVANDEGRGILQLDGPASSDEPIAVIPMGDKVRLEFPPNDGYSQRGTYHLDMPAGAFKITYADGSSRLSDAEEFFFWIPVVPYPSCIPAPGDVTELSTFTLYFTEADNCVFEQSMVSPSLFKKSENGDLTRVSTTEMVTPRNEFKGAKAVEYRLTGGAVVNTPGDYVFKISKSAFSAKGEGLGIDSETAADIAWNNCEYTWNFTIVTPSSDIVYMEDGVKKESATVKALESITLTVPGAVNGIVINPDKKCRLADDFDDDVDTAISLSLSEDDPRSLIVTFTPAVTADGDYVFEVPAGAISVGGEANPMFYMTITVDSSIVIPEPTPEPETTVVLEYYNNGEQESIATVKSLDAITLTASGEEGEMTLDPAECTFTTAQGNPVATVMTLSADGYSLNITFDPAVTEAGEYILTIPEGSVQINGNINADYKLGIVVDPQYGENGISFIGATETVDVYRADGTLAGRNLDAKAIEALPAGLYIAGGRKIIVK
ncbi:MAG: hypothetical protein NC328_02180 [Muribaculum sp.]|nr:hypothetical protein [Muribaculum sp.]